MTTPSIPAPRSGSGPVSRSPRHDVVAGLDVAVRHRRSDTVVRVVGELDAATAPRFVDVVDSVLGAAPVEGPVEAPVRTVWCDLGDLTFVAAAGVTALETASRLAGTRGASLHLVGGSRPLHRVLSLTGSWLVVRPDGVPDDAPLAAGGRLDRDAEPADSAT